MRKDFVLSIVIPCYNERDNILAIVKKVMDVPVENKEIIIVDDCSKDGTRDILKEQVTPLVSKVIYHEKNTGKGGALRTGFQEASGDIIIIQDADQEYDPQEIPKVIEPIVNGETAVCYGSRFLNQKRKGYLANILANKFLTWFSNLMTGQSLTDMETCYKAFRREVIQSVDIVEKRFGFEPEITGKVSQMGHKIMEVPISYNPRTNEEGKKIGVSDGIRALYCIWKYRK